MAFVLTLAGTALAVALELLEALAIVLAVGASRRWRDAVLGAAGAVVACALLALLLGPLLVARVAVEPLRLVVGAALLLFGLEWLRKGILRLAGRRARSSSWREYEKERQELYREPAVAGGPDWAARTVAFKGVLLEGVEVILIVTALAGPPGNRLPALLGAGAAVLVTVATGAVLHRPLRRLPETELKLAVGIVLTSFGAFFAGEGLGVRWPLGDAALLAIVAVFAVAAWAMAAGLSRQDRRAPAESAP